MELLQFDRPAANEFLEVYKGVVPEYNVRTHTGTVSRIVDDHHFTFTHMLSLVLPHHIHIYALSTP